MKHYSKSTFDNSKSISQLFASDPCYLTQTFPALFFPKDQMIWNSQNYHLLTTTTHKNYSLSWHFHLAVAFIVNDRWKRNEICTHLGFWAFISLFVIRVDILLSLSSKEKIFWKWTWTLEQFLKDFRSEQSFSWFVLFYFLLVATWLIYVWRVMLNCWAYSSPWQFTSH